MVNIVITNLNTEYHKNESDAKIWVFSFVDKPPEIGPRKEFLKKVAPKPPPRPSKAAELVQRKFDLLKMERMNNSNIEKHQLRSPELRESNREINTSTSTLQRVSNPKNDPSAINANFTGVSPYHSHRQQPILLCE